MSLVNLMRTFALALCAVILASCVVEVDETTPSRPGICTREYAPVCATRGAREKTFTNACEARRAGWAIEARGECNRIIVDPIVRPEPLLCPQVFRPVCATRNGRERTFENSCEADAAGWRTVSRGECRDVIIEPIIEPVPEPRITRRFCNQLFAPVCATRGGRAKTFDNSCVAESEGWRVIDQGEC
jgi:Kazal-type serine protease inhibitor domain